MKLLLPIDYVFEVPSEMATRAVPGLEPKPSATAPAPRTPAPRTLAKATAMTPMAKRSGFDARCRPSGMAASIVGLVFVIAASCASRTVVASVE
jgi:hypothetical protein